MSLTEQNTAAFTLLAQKLNQLNSKGGALASLNTASKTSLVAAINDVLVIATNAQTAASNTSYIDDSDATSTTTTLSASEITAQLTALNTALTAQTNTAIATALEGEDLSDLAASVAALAAADNNLISASAVQSFDATQQQTARNNIGAASATDLNAADTAITQIQTDVGDVANYDPVTLLNTTLDF